ncbi:hypothetical protein HYC85_023387 [Camellia sinensis]|uniref:Uncharacterized protein n=1 Tax=Camellia sinensis TaxID=4442 RepID=A0A7J7GI87_CAMSI|nr:hypothetical protein HYC85_023387 [Camellia sinensis]
MSFVRGSVSRGDWYTVALFLGSQSPVGVGLPQQSVSCGGRSSAQWSTSWRSPAWSSLWIRVLNNVDRLHQTK